MFARVNEKKKMWKYLKQAVLPEFYLTAKFRCFKDSELSFTDSELSFNARRHIDEHYFVGHSFPLNS